MAVPNCRCKSEVEFIVSYVYNSFRIGSCCNAKNQCANTLVYVKADSRGSGANEEFYYHSAYICDGFSYEGLMELIKEGKVFVDLRIGQYPDGRTHDHGTGFRIRECDQDALFNKHQIV